MTTDASPRGGIGARLGGLVTQARYGSDVIAARARAGQAARWLQAARELDASDGGRRSHTELEALALELRRDFLRGIARLPRPRVKA